MTSDIYLKIFSIVFLRLIAGEYHGSENNILWNKNLIFCAYVCCFNCFGRASMIHWLFYFVSSTEWKSDAKLVNACYQRLYNATFNDIDINAFGGRYSKYHVCHLSCTEIKTKVWRYVEGILLYRVPIQSFWQYSCYTFNGMSSIVCAVLILINCHFHSRVRSRPSGCVVYLLTHIFNFSSRTVCFTFVWHFLTDNIIDSTLKHLECISGKLALNLWT